MMDKKDIISKLAGYKLEGDIEGREKTCRRCRRWRSQTGTG